MVKVKRQGLVLGFTSVVLVIAGMGIGAFIPRGQYNFITADTSSNVAAKEEASKHNNTSSLGDVVDAKAATVDATDNKAPIYKYVEDGVEWYYETQIQEKIFEHYQNFSGVLPPYEDVLCLWISESGLDPHVINENADGTCDFGIPQLNTKTLQECYNKGWLTANDDIYDADLQIELGLKVLNYYCVECPGGPYPFYRAYRGYALGVGGLAEAEANGDDGLGDDWYEDAYGQWYPGKYGKIRAIKSRLVDITP